MIPNPDTVLLSQRPMMPTPQDETRSIHQRSRLSLLIEDWDELADEYDEKRVHAERLATWGLPDTSSNLVAEICVQLSTPGLYSGPVTIGHATPEAQALVGPGGFMERAGYWTMMQRVQYIVTGLSDEFVALDVRKGKVCTRIVHPHDVFLVTDPDEPDVILQFWRLRLRYLPAPYEKWCWAWDCYDLGERVETVASDGQVSVTEVRPPSFRIVAASGDLDGEEISNLFPGLSGLAGSNYRWRYEDGTPFIPFVKYSDVDSKEAWNWTHRRGLMRAAMNSQTHWRYAGHAAQDASGRTVVAWGLVPVGANTQDGGTKDKVRHIQLSPGSIVYHEVEGQTQPGVEEIGPGANVADLLDFAERYDVRQYRRMGIDAAGAEKGASDPTSGAAKFVSRQQKREIVERVRPLYTRSDLEAIRKTAALLRIAGVATFPEQGYSITYAPIAMSADELAAQREQIEWERKQGHLSEVDAYMRTHPGVDRAGAMAALVRAKAEDAELARAVKEALQERGLTDTPAAPGAPVDGAPAVADTALNGAQAEALSLLVQQVSSKQIAPAVAKRLLPIMFPTISGEEAARIIEEAAAFTPAPPSDERPTPNP
jgi:hypothetical protein